MARNIKGITIELDGNVTPLTNALKKVNNETKEINGYLKEVERSLKFSPGNTELVAQKQRLLKHAITETEEKLKTLTNTF
ncbi:MAG: hypothetical protein GXY87_03140 [Tissierellia bacterium]|nr:hypothetical protein [Tissierellia bacterium]